MRQFRSVLAAAAGTLLVLSPLSYAAADDPDDQPPAMAAKAQASPAKAGARPTNERLPMTTYQP